MHSSVGYRTKEQETSSSEEAAGHLVDTKLTSFITDLTGKNLKTAHSEEGFHVGEIEEGKFALLGAIAIAPLGIIISVYRPHKVQPTQDLLVASLPSKPAMMMHHHRSSTSGTLVSFFLLSSSLLGGITKIQAADSDTPTEWEAKYPMLGSNDLVDVLSYSYDVTVDNDCNYHFTVNFSHNQAFPVGSAETCVPGEVADFDGLPLLAGRAYYDLFPTYVEMATGFNHLSLDYNACGHPAGGFLSPHYDMHFYLVSLEYRAEELVCVTIPGLPLCASEQNTTNGEAFFEVETSVDVARNTTGSQGVALNMPASFTSAVSDAVIYMGMHNLDRALMPATPSNWTEPTVVIGSHYEVVFFEPMLPFMYVAGDEDLSSEQDISYVEQTISTMPVNLEVIYDAEAKVTTVHFMGKSAMCKGEFDNAKEAYLESAGGAPPGSAPSPDDSGSTGARLTAGFLDMFMMMTTLVLVLTSSSGWL